MTRFNRGDRVQLTVEAVDDRERGGYVEPSGWEWQAIYAGDLTGYRVFIYPHNNVIYSIEETDICFYEYELERG